MNTAIEKDTSIETLEFLIDHIKTKLDAQSLA